jgi:hypothetical protein
MSSARRYSTVHDLASLRLHPDGTRVPLDPFSNASGSQRLHPRQARYAVQDVRGNWIAHDAGAIAGGAVKRRRRVEEETQSDEGRQEKAGKKRKTGKGRGTTRRVEFENDLEFLSAPPETTSGSNGYHAVPSSVCLAFPSTRSALIATRISGSAEMYTPLREHILCGTGTAV